MPEMFNGRVAEQCNLNVISQDAGNLFEKKTDDILISSVYNHFLFIVSEAVRCAYPAEKMVLGAADQVAERIDEILRHDGVDAETVFYVKPDTEADQIIIGTIGGIVLFP